MTDDFGTTTVTASGAITTGDQRQSPVARKERGFEIMRDRCDQYLYGPKKVVGNARRREILSELDRTDGYFICHKATIAGEKIACRGDWEARGCGQMGRIAGRLNIINFVPEPNADANFPPSHTLRATNCT